MAGRECRHGTFAHAPLQHLAPCTALLADIVAAGLRETGAIDLAWRGWSTARILDHYYPGTVYGPLPATVQSP